jgi:hypothetical protein
MGEGGRTPIIRKWGGGNIPHRKFAEQCCLEIVFSFNFYTSDTIFRENDSGGNLKKKFGKKVLLASIFSILAETMSFYVRF